MRKTKCVMLTTYATVSVVSCSSCAVPQYCSSHQKSIQESNEEVKKEATSIAQFIVQFNSVT